MATEFFGAAVNSTAEKATEILGAMKMIEPADIADAVVYILSTPPHVQVIQFILFWFATNKFKM